MKTNNATKPTMQPLTLICACLALSACVSTKTVFPDGRVVTTTSQDPAIVAAVVKGATTGAIEYLRNDRGLRK